MCRYKQWIKRTFNVFHAEGNSGGDYIRITQIPGDDVVHLGVGHCCINVVDAYVPVEFITAMFANFSGDIEELQDAMRKMWPTEYGEELAKKISKHYLGE